MKLYIVVLLVTLAVSAHAGSITRNKRGYLSRTGLCPNPADNRQIRDVRLNYWGMAVIRQSDNPTPACSEKECDEDSHCDGNRKCCPNFCGAKVCTVSMRDPEPCSNFHCPSHLTCKVQLVKCVMPDCPAAESINRPTCVPKEQVHTDHADKLGDYQPDTAADLTATQPQTDAYATQQQQQTPYGNAQYNDQQAYAPPMDQSMAATPGEVPNVVQSPMDAAYATPSQDTLNYQAQPQMDQSAATPPQMDQNAASPPQMDQSALLPPQMDQTAAFQPQMDAPAPEQPALDPPQVVAQPPAQ